MYLNVLYCTDIVRIRTHLSVGELSDALEVVLRASGDAAEIDLLGAAAAERHAHPVE